MTPQLAFQAACVMSKRCSEDPSGNWFSRLTTLNAMWPGLSQRSTLTFFNPRALASITHGFSGCSESITPVKRFWPVVEPQSRKTATESLHNGSNVK